jgi:hypothetical protein
MKRCQYLVSEAPHYLHNHQCWIDGKYEVMGITLCGVHKKKIEKLNPSKEVLEAWTTDGKRGLR